tara:strand:- start:17319 stop:17840 length:522 start_codon:yes stop_codon:yes gene_type:complete
MATKKRIRKDRVNGIYAYSDIDKMFAKNLQMAHDFLCKELGLETTLKYQRKYVYGNPLQYLGCYKSWSNESCIDFANSEHLTLARVIETVGHELRHALQYKEGWFTGHTEHRQRWGKELRGVWKGEEYKGDYLNAPWEIDARAFQQHYGQLTHHLFTEEELNTTLPVYEAKYK